MIKLRAFLLSPLPAAVLGGLVSWASGGFPRPVSIAVFYLLALYALQLVFGLAIYAWLQRTGRQSLGAFACGGLMMVAIPAVPYMVWANVVRPQNTLELTVIVLGLWLLLGAITGATYWKLSVIPEGRPAQNRP